MADCADHAAYSPECPAFRGLLQWPAKNLNGLAEPTSRVLRRAGGTAGWQGPRARRATAQQHRRRCHRGGMGIRTGSSPPFGPPPPQTECAAAHFPLRVTTHDCASLRIVRVAILGMLRATAHVCTPQKARKRACARKSTQAGNPDGGGVKIHCCVAHLCKMTSRRKCLYNGAKAKMPKFR